MFGSRSGLIKKVEIVSLEAIGRLIDDNFAVTNANHARGVLQRQFDIMHCENHSVEGFKKGIHDYARLVAISGRNRFVSQYNITTLQDSATNRGALLLTAGKFARTGKKFIEQAEALGDRRNVFYRILLRPNQVEQVIAGTVAVQASDIDVMENTEATYQSRVLWDIGAAGAIARLQNR